MGKSKNKEFRISVAVVGVTFTILTAFGSLVWACANGSARITQNEIAIAELHEQLGRVEILTVAIAQKVGANVSGLFETR